MRLRDEAKEACRTLKSRFDPAFIMYAKGEVKELVTEASGSAGKEVEKALIPISSSLEPPASTLEKVPPDTWNKLKWIVCHDKSKSSSGLESFNLNSGR